MRKAKALPIDAAQPGSFDWQVSIPDYLPRASFWSQSSVRLPPHILDLASAAIHHSLLPIELLTASIRQTLNTYPESLGQYSPFQGDNDFLLVLADYLQSLSVDLKPHQLLVTNGTQQGIDLFARTFLGPGDTIAVETPCFSGAIDAFRLSHVNLQPIPLDREGIRIDIPRRSGTTYPSESNLHCSHRTKPHRINHDSFPASGCIELCQSA